MHPIKNYNEMNMWSLVKSWLNKNRNFSKQTLTTKQIRQKYSS